MNNLTITGTIVTTPRHFITAENLAVTSFRLCHDHDPKYSSYFTVEAFNDVALVIKNLEKGAKVIISGEIRLRDWDNGDQQGTEARIHPSRVEVI